MKLVPIAVALVVSVTACSKKSGGGGDGGAAPDPAASGGSTLAILNGFEGEVGLVLKGQMAGKGGAAQPVSLALEIKSDKIRLEIPPGMAQGSPVGDKAWGVYNGGEKKIFVVDETKKQAIVLDLNKPGESPLKGLASRGTPGGGAQKPPPKVTKTGKNDKVAGYSCEIWEIAEEAKGKVGEACIAHEGVSWFSFPAAHLPGEHAWAAELLDGKHFPLRFVAFEGGAETGRVEVTRIEKKTLAAAMFEIPAGYKVMDLAQMFGGMGMPSGMPSGMPPGFRPPRPR